MSPLAEGRRELLVPVSFRGRKSGPAKYSLIGSSISEKGCDEGELGGGLVGPLGN